MQIIDEILNNKNDIGEVRLSQCHVGTQQLCYGREYGS